jgi:hypothetical protein
MLTPRFESKLPQAVPSWFEGVNEDEEYLSVERRPLHTMAVYYPCFLPGIVRGENILITYPSRISRTNKNLWLFKVPFPEKT